MQIKLKPCPFCGGAPKMEELGDPSSFHVVCEPCAMGFHAYFTPQQAADRWNKRAADRPGVEFDVEIPHAIRWADAGHA